MFRNLNLLLLLMTIGVGLSLAQDAPTIPDDFDCAPQSMAALYEQATEAYPIDFENDPLGARNNLFALGAFYEDIALTCRYLPDETQTDALIERTLSVAPLSRIVASLGVGTDVEAALDALESVGSDSFNGQLLYTGVENGLDGVSLGCSTCHSNDENNVAPMTVGTYTRVVEERLTLEQFTDYTVEQYLVESILHPNEYVVTGYEPVMAQNYGSRLDAQMLADLVAYLQSQDQLLTD